MLIDSHCHLDMVDLSPYDGDLSALIQTARDAGVSTMPTIGVDISHAQRVIAIAEQFPEIYATVGLHPGENEKIEPSENDLISLATHPKVVGIGETGLDYYYPGIDKNIQRERFRRHIRVAKQLKKPLIIHTRSAQEDTIKIMQEENASEAGGVMHCFTESWDMAEQALDMGFYISISGIVTFKKAEQVADVAKRVPLNKLLIETDSPYLAPVPFRGKKNEPQYVRYVAEHIAMIREMDYAELVSTTNKNFKALFL